MPSQIIDGDAEERSMGELITLQGLVGDLLVGSQIMYARVEGSDGIIYLEYTNGLKMKVKVLEVEGIT